MKTIKETDFVNVTYYEDLKLINVVWLASCESEGYRETWEAILDWGRKNTAYNLFSDIQKQKIVSPIDRKWFEEEIIPEGVKAGLRRAGIVFGGGIFKRYYFNNIMSKMMKSDLPFKAFSTRDEAIEWFKTFND